MEIGISPTSGWSLDDPRDGPARMIERAAAAHAAGLAFLTVGDHHNMGNQYVQNTPIMGRLLAEWPGRPAGPLFLMPLWHPLLMAEHIGTLAAIHDGPLIVQTGVGRDARQFAALGQDDRVRGARTHEMIPVVQSLLAGDTVDRPDLSMADARVGLLPPEPVQWWVGSGVEVGVRRAAMFGDCWYTTPRFTVESGAALMELYRQTCEEEGRPSRVVVRKDVLCLRDGSKAKSLAEDIIAKGYRGMGSAELVFGSVDDVAAQFEAFAAAGVDGIAIRCMATDQNVALETISEIGQLT